jgi:SAM-dependent methyltransferase
MTYFQEMEQSLGGFEYSGLDDLSLMFEAPNYHEWIWDNIKPFCGRRVLEVGAGLGMYTRKLKEGRELVIASDIDARFLNWLREKFKSENVEVAELHIENSQVVERLKSRHIDTIVCINVLEHVRDDMKALRNFFEILQEGGKLALFVPAFPIAYGAFDQLVGHFRRYSKGDLVRKLKLARFRIVKLQYFNSTGLVSWFMFSRVLRAKRLNPWSVKFYDRFVVPVLVFIEKILPPPFGQSLFAICRK